MGYFKNELIASQVEVGDRLPRRKRRSTYQSPYVKMDRSLYEVFVAGYVIFGVSALALLFILAAVA